MQRDRPPKAALRALDRMILSKLLAAIAIDGELRRHAHMENPRRVGLAALKRETAGNEARPSHEDISRLSVATHCASLALLTADLNSVCMAAVMSSSVVTWKNRPGEAQLCRFGPI